MVEKGIGIFSKLAGKKWEIGADCLTSKREESEPINEKYRVAEAVVEFLQKMKDTDGVEAVAFVGVEQAPAPWTVSINVCVPLERDNERSANIVRAVGKADADLAKKTYGLLYSGLCFRNTRNSNLDRIEEHIRMECKEDPLQELLAFCVFDRSQTGKEE